MAAEDNSATMNLLILGGTKFLGRHLVDAAFARGHRVTLFNRGQTNPQAYPTVETILGDREGDLSALALRTWDAVVDTSGYAAATVRKSAQVLRGHIGQYAFISSISAYADAATLNFDESYPLATMPDEDAAKVAKNADVSEAIYGAQKVLCEREVTRVFGDRALNVRAGLLIGPYDATDRFTYWVRRIAQGGEVLVPDTFDQAWQVIDARDLAEWVLTMLERGEGGVFNVTGRRMAMGDILAACKQVSHSDARFVRVSEAFIEQEDIGGWQHLPLWLPPSAKEYAGFWACKIDKALAAGLSLRPISDTIRAILDWDAARVDGLKAGLSREREQELIAKWKP
jgi:2'-hydroxyisoflavone reductase